MDDGQIYCKRSDVKCILRHLDRELAAVGATRGEGSDVKSVVRLLRGTESGNSESPNWDDLALTCQLPGINAASHVLGIDVGDIDSASRQFHELSRKVEELHNSILQVNDAGTELVLLRRCADSCKISHLLRAAGLHVDSEALSKFDKSLATCLERIVMSEMDDAAHTQASIGVKEGGLGLRRAADIALPAFISSRCQARPFIQRLGQVSAYSDILPAGILEEFDAELQLAVERFTARLSVSGGRRALDAIDNAKAHYEAKAVSLFSGTKADKRPSHQDFAQNFITEAGCEDPEFESYDGHLQHDLCVIWDDTRMDELSASLEKARRWTDSRRIRDLRDPSTSHDWMWSLNPAHGPIIPNDELITCIKIRLGVNFLDDEMLCPSCGKQILDRKCNHALCCASAESTRGHYRVRDIVLTLASTVDASSCAEAPGLIPSAPLLRPADVFTRAAIPGCQAALDIGISSPDASRAGPDCCESMRKKKLGDYDPYFPELSAQLIRYVPMTFSTYGRMHEDTVRIIFTMATLAAKKFGTNDARRIYRRTVQSLGVALWRWAANMIHSCMPRMDEETLALLFGGDPALAAPGADPASDAAAAAARTLVQDEGLGVLAA